ncbi:MAG: family 43 glycosylhydrolase [Pirellulales bacterium]
MRTPHASKCSTAAWLIAVSAIGLIAIAPQPAAAQQLTGPIGIHDPSTAIKDGSTYFLYGTGQGIAAKWSTDRINWHDESSGVFSTPPPWTTTAVPGFGGVFWAPDIAYFNGLYHLYYSVSTWGSIDSAIGVATSPTLNRSAPNYAWTDQGKVVQSDAVGFTQPETDTTAYNAIDPSVLVDSSTGRVWMSFGSYSSGILVTELNPATGKRLNTSTLSATLVANNAAGGGWGSTIEGSALVKHGSYYYLMVNYGGCCSGVNSTYEMRVGRSTSPTGPFLDKNGVDMRNGGGTLFLDDDGKMIGPGHFSISSEAGQDYFGYHYYNGDANGAPTYGLRNLYWTADNWPSYAAVNPDWTGAANSNWSITTNWSDGNVPNGAGHVANFVGNSFNRYSVAVDGAGKTASTINFRSASSYTIGITSGNAITLDAANGDAATVNVSAGNHTIAAPIVAADALGINVTPANSTLTLSGNVSGLALTKHGFGKLALGGANTYSGSIFAKYGTIDVTGAVSAAQFSSIGQILGETATMIVRGAGSFSSSADLNIGDTGDANTPATGTLELRENATVTLSASGGFFVGSGFSANTKAVGTVNQTGGTLTTNGNFDGAFVIGGRGSSLATGTYNLSGGAVSANTNVQIGGRGTGTLTQTGGTFNANSYVAIGRYTGATGTWNISGGTLNQSSSTRNLIVGESGSGTLTIGGSAQVTATGAVRLGQNLGGAGVVNLNGGRLTAPSIVRGNGTATLNLDGGTLRAAASSTTFFQGLNSANMRAGGVDIDTQSFDITIAQPLLHDSALGTTLDGGLYKLGVGTLTLTGNNTFTGPTTVSLGKLLVNGTIAGGLTTVSTFATLGGAGTIVGPVTINNGAHLAPGTTGIGTLNVGSLSLASGAILDFEINTAGSSDIGDSVNITNPGGLAITGGKFNLTNVGSITAGSYRLIDYVGDFTGSLSNLSFGAVPAGFNFSLVNNTAATSIDLVATPILWGDYNNNGTVDVADYVVWQKNLGQSAGTLPNDNTGAAIGDQQFNLWRSNFGATSSDTNALGTNTVVPEPNSCVIGMMAAALLMCIRSRIVFKKALHV